MHIDGSIPSSLCKFSNLIIDVTNTSIDCYGGCLKTANVVVKGASSDCPDGSIMYHFLLITVSMLILMLLLSTLYCYQAYNSRTLEGKNNQMLVIIA